MFVYVWIHSLIQKQLYRKTLSILGILCLVCRRRRENQQTSVCLKEVREEAIAVQLVLTPMTDTQLPRLLLQTARSLGRNREINGGVKQRNEKIETYWNPRAARVGPIQNQTTNLKNDNLPAVPQPQWTGTCHKPFYRAVCRFK